MNPVDGGDAAGDSASGDKASARFHSLPEEYFAELSRGKGSPEVIEYLWTTELSRRLLLLRTIYDDIQRDAELQTRLPASTECWRTLGKAQAVAPQRFTALLMQPQVGSYFAYVLRRWRNGAQSSAPKHTDYGQINTLALCAAALAGLPFSTTVPLRAGRVMLPCLGMAYFEGCEHWDVAEADVTGGRIRLRYRRQTVEVPADPGTDTQGWWGLRRLNLSAGGSTLTVWLDDLDPMRDLADPIQPGRLPGVEVERWTGLLRDAWTILSQTQPELAEAIAAGVTSFVPLPPADGWDTRSASSGDAFGAVLCSPPPDALTLAVALAHEFMHVKLGGLMHLLPMSRGGEALSLYAPWRDDPRPLGGLIQGIYAFVGIAAFWRRYRDRVTGTEQELANFEYAYARAQAKTGLATARAAAGVTPAGLAFIDGLDSEVGSWESDAIPPEVDGLARLVADGHRAGWRIRHCHPDRQAIAGLAAAWAARDPARAVGVGQSAVHPDPAMRHWSQARLGLARRRIVSRDRIHEARGESWGEPLTDGDLALFGGEPAKAANEFVEQIYGDGGSVDAWIGLGLSLTANRHASEADHAAGAAILTRPEVVLAAYLQATAAAQPPPPPVEFAGWARAAMS